MTNLTDDFSTEFSSNFTQISESNILRCPFCSLIPQIKIDFKNNILQYSCRNNHSEKGDFNYIYKRLKSSNLNIIKCLNCDKNSNKYCINCFKFFCEEHAKKDESENKHKTININKIDKICFEHFESIAAFCNDDKKPICINCVNCYDNHDIKLLRKIDDKKINEFKEKLNKFKDYFFPKNDEFINKINELEKILKDSLEKINKLKNNYIKEKNLNFEFFHSFFIDLLNSYELKINNKNERNHNIFKNLETNFSFNLNTDNIDKIQKNKFIEFSKIFSDLKLKLNNIKIDNSSLISLSNSNIFCFSYAFCLKNLHDNRLILGNYESKLIIFNQNLINIDLEIENNLESIYDIEELKNFNIACCFKAKAIRIFKIEKNDYQIIQTITNAHSSWIYKIIELNNNNLVSCSDDKSLKIWKLNEKNQNFEENFILLADDYIRNIIEMKKNIIVYNVNYNNLEIYDLNNNKRIKSHNNLSLSTKIGSQFVLVLDNLIIGGDKKIYILNNEFDIQMTIDYESNIVSVLSLFNEVYVIGDSDGNISIFQLFKKEPILVKKKAHEGSIRALAYLDYSIISAGTDDIIKKWEE